MECNGSIIYKNKTEDERRRKTSIMKSSAIVIVVVVVLAGVIGAAFGDCFTCLMPWSAEMAAPAKATATEARSPISDRQSEEGDSSSIGGAQGSMSDIESQVSADSITPVIESYRPLSDTALQSNPMEEAQWNGKEMGKTWHDANVALGAKTGNEYFALPKPFLTTEQVDWQVGQEEEWLRLNCKSWIDDMLYVECRNDWSRIMRAKIQVALASSASPSISAEEITTQLRKRDIQKSQAKELAKAFQSEADEATRSPQKFKQRKQAAYIEQVVEDFKDVLDGDLVAARSDAKDLLDFDTSIGINNDENEELGNALIRTKST